MSDPKQLVPEGIKIRGKHGLKIEDVRKEIELGFVKRFFKYHKKELKNDLDKMWNITHKNVFCHKKDKSVKKFCNLQ